jgi:hypothetical protein
MLYKRPMFKMGGSPTGIETLEPRKKFQFGTSGFSFLEPGLQRELQIQNELRNKPTQPTRFNQLFKRFPRILPLGIYGTAATAGAGIGALADFYAKSTKTPEEYRRLKQMSGANFNFDETNPDVGEILEYIDKGGEIGEAPGFFPRGGKEKFFKDKGLDPKTGLPIKDEADDFEVSGGVVTPRPGESALDAVLREGKVIPEKKEEPEIKIKDNDQDGEVKEDSFDSMFNKQLSRLEKYLGSTNRETKGKVALALSDAVGTPGSLADKAAVLNKALLGIAATKKKDKRELAKLAFAATTELEKADRMAGKKGFSERRFDEYANLATLKNRTDEQERRFQILKDGLGIKSGLTGPSATAAGKIANEVNKSIVDLQTASEDEKANIQSEIIAGINQLLLIQGVTRDNVSGIIGFDVSNYLKADGGRVQKAMGGPTETPAEPVATNLTFEQLRTRLPKEITDDIVRLVATSEEALQDFAYIRTQGDVEKFNVKYGVNLVLPQTTA